MAELKNINGAVNIVGEIEATSLDINGSADISGGLVLPSVNNTHNFKAFGGDSDSYFQLSDDANNSVNVLLTRSDGAEVFKIMGHTQVATFGGNITLGDSHTIGDDADDNLEIKSSSNENVIIDGASSVLLRDGGSTKLQTKSSGVNVTGELEATTLDINGSADISGALVVHNQITGTELEGTSLDMNGSADISGDLTVHGKITQSGIVDYERYGRSYTVNVNAPLPILTHGGNALPTGGGYRVTGHISGTGTEQVAMAVFWNENGTWNINKTFEGGTSSNHVEFKLLDHGSGSVPTVTLETHTSNYNVYVYHERLALDEGTGTDNLRGYFGADSYLSWLESTNTLTVPGSALFTGAGEFQGNIRANVSNAGGFMLTGASASGLVRNNGTGVALRTNTTDRLVIDNSGNATFAKDVVLSQGSYYFRNASDSTQRHGFVADHIYEFNQLDLQINAARKLYLDGGSNSYIHESASDVIDVVTGGSTRLTVNSNGISSSNSVYSGGSGDFRNYSGTWRGTTGQTGNGFQFINSADGTALTLSSTGNATFAGNIITSSNTGVIQTPRISMEHDGTLDWGAARDYGTLTWDTGKIMIRAQSGKAMEFQTNGSTTALTIDTSQNANFVGSVYADGGILVGQTSAYSPTGGGDTLATFTGAGNDRQDIVVSNQTNHADAGAALVLATHGHDFIIKGQSSAGGSNITFHRAAALMATIGTSQATFAGELEAASLDINGNAEISGHLSVDTVTNSTVDLDKFLVIDSGNRIYYRTGAQVLSDIGAGTGSSNGDVTLSGAQTFTGAKTFNAATQFNSTVTVGADTSGHDVKFHGNDTGEMLHWDESTSKLNIRHDHEDCGLTIFTVSSAQNTVPQLQVGRDSAQYWGVYTDDRNAHLVHRQDETSGKITTRFDQWDSNTSDTTGEWLWRFGGGDGSNMDTALTLKQNGDVYMRAAAALYMDNGGDTYIQESAANNLLFATNGNAALTLDSSQNATFAGIVDITNSTEATDSTGDTGALRVEGGVSSAGHIYAEGFVSQMGRAEIDSETSRLYPLGHYTTGKEVFSIDPTWTQQQLEDYFDLSSSQVAWATESDAPAGWSIRFDGSVGVGIDYNSGLPMIPIDDTSIYFTECWIKNVGSNQKHYMGSIEREENFAAPSTGQGNPGSYGYHVMSNFNPGSSWTRVTGYVTGRSDTTSGNFETDANYFSPQALFNYTAGTGTRACIISGWRIIKIDKQEYFADGTAALPAITNYNDPNTGIYFEGADTINISTTGTKRLTVNSDGHILIPDNKQIKLGAGNDLTLYSNGTDGYVLAPVDDLVLQAADDVFIYTQGGEDAIIARGDGGVELYHNNVKKLDTTSSGIEVTGEVQGDSLNIDGNADISGTLNVSGASTLAGDPTIVDDSSHVRLYLRSDSQHQSLIYFGRSGATTQGRVAYNNSNDSLYFNSNNATALTLDSSQNATFSSDVTSTKLNVNQAADDQGLQINGYDDRSGSTATLRINSAGHTTLSQTTANGSGYLFLSAENYLQLSAGALVYTQTQFRVYDSAALTFGSGGDSSMRHDGSNFAFTNATGNVTFTQNVVDGDIIFKADNGSGTATEYFRLDGGQTQSIFSQNIQLQDNARGKFGTGGDLQIFHDGSNSYISQGGTGDLYIQQNTNDKDLVFQCDDGSGGSTAYFFLDGSQANTNFQKDVIFADSKKAMFGGSGDLQIYHDGSNSYIQDVGSGDLRITTSGGGVKINKGVSENIAHFIPDGSVDLYYNNSKKFETTAYGAKTYYTATSNTDGDAAGDIVYLGETTTVAGKIYYYTSGGGWELTDADAESTAKGMLGVALGTSSGTHGMLIRGMVTLDHDPGTIADTLFLSTAAGAATATAPSGTGDIVRVIGYSLNSTNGQIYFNPDGAFVEVTAG